MPSSLRSPYMSDMDDTVDLPVPDLATSVHDPYLSRLESMATSLTAEDIVEATLSSAADADNVSFLRMIPSDSDSDDNASIDNASREVTVTDTNGARERTGAGRVVIGGTGSSDSPRLRRLHSRAREIRVEDRALRDRLQRILNRLNHMHNSANVAHGSLFDSAPGTDIERYLRDRVSDRILDHYGYGQVSRAHAGGTNGNSENGYEDEELERIVQEFRFDYERISSPGQNQGQEGSTHRTRRSGQGDGQEQALGAEHARGTRHRLHQFSRLDDANASQYTERPLFSRSSIPPINDELLTRSQSPGAQANATLLQAASRRQPGPLPRRADSFSSISRSRLREYSNLQPNSRQDHETALGNVEASERSASTVSANISDGSDNWFPPSQEQMRRMDSLLRGLERSNQARFQIMRRERERERAHEARIREESGNGDGSERPSSSSRTPSRAERLQRLTELERLVESLPALNRQIYQSLGDHDVLQRDARARVNAYRRAYLENPGSSTRYYYPSPRRSPTPSLVNSSVNTLNVSANSVTGTATTASTPALPVPSSLPVNLSTWPEQTLKYLARIRSSSGFEDSLSHAIIAGLATSEFFVEHHDDFVMEVESLTGPVETSWLAPGQVFCGFQRALMGQQHDRYGRSNNRGEGVTRYSGENSTISRVHRFPNARTATASTMESSRVPNRSSTTGNLGLSSDTTPAGQGHDSAVPGNSRSREQQLQNRWPVKVTIHSVDYTTMTMTATMEARNVPSHPIPYISTVPQRFGIAINTSPTPSTASTRRHVPPAGSILTAPVTLSSTSSISNSSSTTLTSSHILTQPRKYSLTTYLEGELIDYNTFALLTESFDSSPENDMTHWRQLEPFRGLTDNQLVRKLVSRREVKMLQENYVLMRWKEKCFVKKQRRQPKKPNERTISDTISENQEHETSGSAFCAANEDQAMNDSSLEDVDPTDPDACGLTISGFYYVCLRRSDGALEGLYYDPQSTPYQRLCLQPGYGGGSGDGFQRIERAIKRDKIQRGVEKVEDGSNPETFGACGRKENGFIGESGALGVFPTWTFR